jgi:fluoride exporter
VSLPLVLGIGLVGGCGAIARFLIDAAVAARLGRSFPFGTLAVNASGALILGVLVGASVAGDAYALAATGALGAFTTFSTWMLETHRLAEDGQLRLAGWNAAVSLALGLAAAELGRLLGGAL